MKTKICTLIIFTALILTTQHVYGFIRRVGYWGTPLANVDYSDLQSAHDAAAAGDTLLIFPGSWNANYSKKLVTIGYGYFTDTSALGTGANPGLQNIKGSLSISVSLFAAAENSVFEGLDGASIYPYYNELVNNITIRRCKGLFYFNDKASNNWQILQCYIEQLRFYWGGGGPTNLTVNNCYVDGIYLSSGSAGIMTGQFNNCIFNNTDFGNGAFVVKNSIFIYYRGNDAGSVYQYSLFNTLYGSVPSGTGNIGVDQTAMESSVFVGYSTQGSYSNDAKWALPAGSPAKGAGQGGADMGMFGGANPYKLSGMPRIPAIYRLTAPSNLTSGNPYTITLSVRSNN